MYLTENIFLILVIYCCGCLSWEFPTEVDKCTYSDPICMRDRINKILKTKASGYNDLNLMPIDPLHVRNIKFIHGEDGPVNLNINFNNIDFVGFSKSNIYKVVGFSKKIQDTKHEVYLKAPTIQMLADYDMNGRVLILPIQGNGRCNLTAVAPNMKIRFLTKTYTKNGKEYMQVDKLRFVYDVKRLYINFENLFNGDKALTENTNAFLNENWLVIFEEIKETLYKVFGEIVKNLLNNIFKRAPYAEMFDEY